MELRVKPLKQEDAGKGLAALDREAMREMGLENGDYATIEGEERAYARVWPGYPADEGEGVVRIDAEVREAAGVGVNDAVAVEPADVAPADRLTLALPADLPPDLRAPGAVETRVRDGLGGQVVSDGQRVSLPSRGTPVAGDTATDAMVTGTVPSSPAVVTEATTVGVANRRLKDLEGDRSRARRLLGRLTRRIPGSRQLVAHPVVGVAAVLAFVGLVVGGAYYLGRVTGPSFRTWIQVVGTVALVLLSALTVWQNHSG